MIEIEPYRELWKREEQDNKELREIIEEKDKEIERLNNIINEKNKMINNTRHFMANLELSTLKEKEHLHDIDMRLMYIYNYWGVDKE